MNPEQTPRLRLVRDGDSGGRTPPEPAPEGPRAFDAVGPLPHGDTVVLEASAGTGKTWTIAALTARYLAEGVATLDQLMIVTFSRAATHELRNRVRSRLVEVEQHLTQTLAGGDPGPLDEVSDLLCTGPPEELRRRRDRISAALAEFDAATIATTHEFCQRMLAGLGVLADSDRRSRLAEDLSQLTREVAADAYLRRYSTADPPPFDFETALTMATAAISAGPTPLVPTAARGVPGERVAFCAAVRDEVERRKRRLGLYTFDDLMTRLAEAIDDATTGPLARRRLRERYRVVLIDEFQDTDPLQWKIVRDTFHRHSTLVLIGDPKQAIYGFRGADVYSYLAAVRQAREVWTLPTNRRTDSGLVTALHAVFGGAALGDARIRVPAVRAHHEIARLRDIAGPPVAPLRLRILDPGTHPRWSMYRLREAIEADVAADIAQRLSSGVEYRDDEGWRPVRAGDIAVLVRTNYAAESLRGRLAEAAIPAVLTGASSVFASEAAADWATLLGAMADPRAREARKAARTAFFGWGLGDLADADDDRLGEVSRRLKSWRAVLAHSGMAAAQDAIFADTAVAPRLLALRTGERTLTDLRHVGEALHEARQVGNLSLPGLLAWLVERTADARRGDDRSRRLETDAQAVQIMTVHGAKGLEFPIVYLPDLWNRRVDSRRLNVMTLHDADDARVTDVGGQAAPGRREREASYLAEDAGDSLRQLYVAATRAQCQVVAWWASNETVTPSSALHRLLQRAPGADVVAPAYDASRDPRDLEWIAAAGIALETVTPNRRRPIPDSGFDDPTTLTARTFERQLDRAWRRSSYSALTAAAHDQPHRPDGGSELPAGAVDDEPVEDGPGVADQPGAAEDADRPGAAEDADRPGAAEHADRPGAAACGEGLQAPSPMAELPGGTAFGSLVHAIAEYIDPHTDDLFAVVRAEVATQLGRLPPVLRRGDRTAVSADDLAAALLPSLRTPLGPLADDLRLCDFAVADRLPELDFEMPLAGGENPRGAATLAQVADVVQRHLPATDPLAPYPDRLRDPALAEETLRGFLTGSIDAVLRVGGATPRYLVVDYKTNWLAPTPQSALRLGHYAPQALAAAMMDSHYPLQALLYSVALHRFLRWRQPGYDPDRHLGGTLYLFMRGMAGAETPIVDGQRCGVFSWLPPAALVVELSQLLAEGGPR